MNENNLMTSYKTKEYDRNKENIDDSNDSDDNDDILGIFKTVYPRKNKKIKFSSSVKVTLVPTAQEYHNAGISNDLWWPNLDLDKFKQNFKNDLLVISALNHMSIDNNDNLSKIKKIWYESLRIKQIE